MSARIVEAVNSMILNSENITDVVLTNEEEYIFQYKKKYVWGILKMPAGSEYKLFYYPKAPSSQVFGGVVDWEGITFVTYSSKEIGTAEATSSMAELLTIVQEKMHGLDEVLNDIISDY